MKKHFVWSVTAIFVLILCRINAQEPYIYTDPAYPAPVSLAASWNPELVQEIAGRMAQNASSMGNDMLLIPGMNIYRNPLSGRNFLSFGEDPFLSSQMAGAFVQGASKYNMRLCAGNFALDNQEWGKPVLEIMIDERTLREIYLPAFKESVGSGKVGMVMMDANKVYGIGKTLEEDFLLSLLRDEWGYKDSILPGTSNYKLSSLSGPLPEQDKAMALEAARAGIVLLKNHGGLLPLDADSISSIALIGPNLFLARSCGGGITGAEPSNALSPYEAIKALLGETMAIWTAQGVNLADDMAPSGAAGEEASEREIDFNMLADAVEKAAKADVAIIFAGLSERYESVGYDRKSLDMPMQSRLIRAIYEANPNTIVVLQSGAAIDIEAWAFDVPAIIQAWYPGQYGSEAIAEVLFGHFNPSGRLPFTWAMEESHYPGLKAYRSPSMRIWYLEGMYLGYRYMDKHKLKARFPFGHGLSYTTFGIGKLLMQRNRDGSGWTATVEIRNLGTRTGTEVLQLYVAPPESKIPTAEKGLKAFKRVTLLPGQKKTVSISLPYEAFAYFDMAENIWTIDPGLYEILIGTSAEDIKLRRTIEIKESHIKQ